MPAPDQGGHVQNGHMVRADLITGLALVAIGLAIMGWSWTMPRLENRGVPIYTAPGIVPGVLGLVLALCGGLLSARSRSAFGVASGWRAFASMFFTPETGRALVAMALALGYALVLVGWLPFWLATAAFIFAFIVVFEGLMSDAPRPLLRLAATSALQAVIAAVVVVAVFERGFLVRLP
jgi:hypothetical protein